MKQLTTLLMSLALASAAVAGPIASKNPKAPVMPPPPAGCECFAPGFALGLFGAGIGLDSEAYSDDTEFGGGVLAEYFFSEYVGFQGSYGLFSTESEHHAMDANLILRAPIKSICIAPYALVGGGYSANSENLWNVHAGGGIEARFESLGCMGLFADGAYYWTEDSDATGDEVNHVIVRVGVKIPF